MSKTKKIGIVLILVGICLPILLLGFASNYHPQFGLIGNIQRMEILLRQESPSDIFDIIKSEKPYKPKIAIPYKYIFAVGIILVFTGIGTIALSDSKRNRVEQ